MRVVEDGRATIRSDHLATEEPLEIRLVAGGTGHTAAVTMRTPGDEFELAVAGGSRAERAMPAAIVGVLLLQVLPKGRMKRLGLAVLGSALVAGLVAGRQQQNP